MMEKEILIAPKGLWTALTAVLDGVVLNLPASEVVGLMQHVNAVKALPEMPLKGELDAARATISELEATISELEATISELEDTIDELAAGQTSELEAAATDPDE